MEINGRLINTTRFLTDTWVDAQRTFAVTNPATNQEVAQVADCGPAEALVAVDVSVRAFDDWRRHGAYERAKVLRRFAELMLENRETLAQLMTTEMGKPIRETRGEVAYAAGFVDWYADEAKRIYGETIPASARDKRIEIHYAPVGPVVGITPWNFPSAMVTRKLAPAMAAGCSFILKPAEQSPITALLLGELMLQAGAPPGVFQVLPTSSPEPLVTALLEDPRVRKLTFTGSTDVGRQLYAKAALTVKRVSLELGGHAPILVFSDADIEQAAVETVASKFRNAGQTCVCGNRIYVADTIADEFVEALVNRVRALVVGDPLLESTDIGPLVDAQGLEKVVRHVDDAISKGAKVILGGRGLDEFAPGLFYEPTVFTGASANMLACREETFGPVAPVMTFDSEDEAVAMANSTPFGLAAYFFTKDASRIRRVFEALDFGIIGVNDGVPSTPQAPFGGVKASGVGREGGRHGLLEYLEAKYISSKVSLTPHPRS